MKTYLFSLFLLCLTLPLCSDEFDQIIQQQQFKLDQALKDLEQQRELIYQKQIPLSKESQSLKENITSIRKEISTLQAVEDSKTIELDTLKNSIKESEKEIRYIENTLADECIVHVESNMSIGEYHSKGHPLKQAIDARQDLAPDNLAYLQQQLAILDQTVNRVQNLFEPQQYKGQALDQDGEVLEGDFIQTGPVLYFVSQDQKNSGLISESMSLKPLIHPLPDEANQALLNFANGKASTLPIDPSLKRALLVASTKDTPEEHIKKGGVWVYPILFFAALSFLIALVKFIQLFTLRLPAQKCIPAMAAAIKAKDFEEAEKLAQAQPKPGRQMLLSAVEYADEPIELIEEVMMESILKTQPKLESFLNILAVTAATAPLLGLLGTVTGIIKTFKLMEVFGAGDPKPLISGISEALITTELGLVLAIPALILHALLSRRVTSTISKLEQFSFRFVNVLAKKDKPENQPAT